MTSPRLFFIPLLASVTLVSCGAFEHVDSRLPTIAQQDAYDVGWGISPRKSRGNPKRQFQYNARNELPPQGSAAPAAPAAAPAPAPAPTPAPSRAPISPVVPPNLR